MPILGGDSIGRFALGQIRASIPQSLTAACFVATRLKASGAFSGVLSAKALAASEARVGASLSSAVQGRISTQTKMSAPGGLTMSGRITGQLKENVSPGYVLKARLQGASEGTGDAHIQIVVNPTRRPLYTFTSGLPTNVYWKDNG